MIVGSKICSKCKEEKFLEAFYAKKTGKDGRASHCKMCEIVRVNAWTEKNKDKRKDYLKTYRENNLEHLQAYFQDWVTENRDSYLEGKKKWYLDNPEYRSTYDRAYYLKNTDKLLSYQKMYREANLERIRERSRIYFQQNKHIFNIAAAKRKASLIQAIPSWADFGKIKAIYKEREHISKETGEKYHVDHIVPLRGRNVCGLHVEYNLRVIPAKENLQKNAKLIEELL